MLDVGVRSCGRDMDKGRGRLKEVRFFFQIWVSKGSRLGKTFYVFSIY